MPQDTLYKPSVDVCEQDQLDQTKQLTSIQYRPIQCSLLTQGAGGTHPQCSILIFVTGTSIPHPMISAQARWATAWLLRSRIARHEMAGSGLRTVAGIPTAPAGPSVLPAMSSTPNRLGTHSRNTRDMPMLPGTSIPTGEFSGPFQMNTMLLLLVNMNGSQYPASFCFHHKLA